MIAGNIDAGWGDYLATDGSSDLSVELSQAADVDQAAASSYADASTDLSYTGGDLPADVGAADAAWDTSVNANLAGDSLDSASADPAAWSAVPAPFDQGWTGLAAPTDTAVAVDGLHLLPAWYPDPSGRHEFRWWDGQGWAEFALDQDQSSADPL